jgi:hypothetical protein
MRLSPHQAMSRMFAVHLLVECSLTPPVLESKLQMKRNPSFASPSVARNLESGLKATARTPKECSGMIESGMSIESLSVEKINTRGQ